MSRSRRSTSDTGYFSGGSYSPRKDEVFEEEFEDDFKYEVSNEAEKKIKSKSGIKFDIGDEGMSEPQGLKDVGGMRVEQQKKIWLPSYYQNVCAQYQQPAEGFENPQEFSKNERPGTTIVNQEATLLNKILSWWLRK